MRPTSTRTWRARGALLLAAVGLTIAATACQPMNQLQTPLPPPPPPPTLATATCTTATTRSITVSDTIVNHLRQLLAAAKADGVKLCGGGYRSSAGQIAVRKTNCGTTEYDIYEKPADQCTPPTARPGTSMHERGLAIDFETCDTHTTACYVWLAAHAKAYGFANLPSEPWHWSTNGH